MDCISECFSDVVIMLQGSTDVTDVGLLLSIFMIFVHFVCSLLIKEPLSQLPVAGVSVFDVCFMSVKYTTQYF